MSKLVHRRETTPANRPQIPVSCRMNRLRLGGRDVAPIRNYQTNPAMSFKINGPPDAGVPFIATSVRSDIPIGLSPSGLVK